MNNKLISQVSIDEQCRVLIVDDDEMNLEILKEILKDKYEIRSACSGIDCLNELKNGFNPDLILLDVVMPKMDGYEVCQIIKKNSDYKDIPIIFLTSKMSTHDKVKAFEFGANDYITKPFEFEEVLARINTHLSLRKASLKLNLYNEKLEELLDERQRELIETEKQAGFSLLIQGIIHNLRGPLTTIIGNINLTSLMIEAMLGGRKEFNEKNLRNVLNFAGKSMESCDKLSSMIDSLMAKSRNDKTEELEVVDLNEIITQELDFLDADIHFKHNVDKDIQISDQELRIQVVVSEVSQVFQNLIRNALDAMYKQQEPAIEIRTSKIGPTAFFYVKDNGKGMPAEVVKNIFDPFFTTKPKKRKDDPNEPIGTGLGLHTCQEIIKSYNGDIKVISEEGKGTKFIVSLPLYV